MTIVRPFKGILYDRGKVGTLKDVVAPPYDVITTEAQDRLYASHPHNIVRLILGKEEPQDSASDNKYRRAKAYFEGWLKKGVLKRDAKGAFYVYNQEYREDGAKKHRIGFIGLMKLEAMSGAGVLPHEKTFRKPKEDRLKLMREVKANLSPIFAIYQDDGRIKRLILASCRKRRPDIDVSIDGVRHALWRLTDAKAAAEIERLMSNKRIFIADGHHRYKVALAYRDESRRRSKGPRPCDYVMMYFTDMDEGGLTILASHRMVRDAGGKDEDAILALLRKDFAVMKGTKGRKGAIEWLKRDKKSCHTFGLYMNGSFYPLKLKSKRRLKDIDMPSKSKEWKALDVSILHCLVMKKVLKISDREGNISYTRDPDEAMGAVDDGLCDLAFLLKPTKISQVRILAQKGELMPHKATYFYPKLLSGLVINKF